MSYETVCTFIHFRSITNFVHIFIISFKINHKIFCIPKNVLSPQQQQQPHRNI